MIKKIFAFSAALLPTLLVVSCGSKASSNTISHKKIQLLPMTLKLEKVSKMEILSKEEYNKVFTSLSSQDVGIVIIANGKTFIEKIEIENGTHPELKDILIASSIAFRIHNITNLGSIIGSFKLLNSDSYRHGKSSTKIYEDYYPMIAWNHKISELGVSGRHVDAKDIYELSYDHEK